MKELIQREPRNISACWSKQSKAEFFKKSVGCFASPVENSSILGGFSVDASQPTTELAATTVRVF